MVGRPTPNCWDWLLDVTVTDCGKGLVVCNSACSRSTGTCYVGRPRLSDSSCGLGSQTEADKLLHSALCPCERPDSFGQMTLFSVRGWLSGEALATANTEHRPFFPYFSREA